MTEQPPIVFVVDDDASIRDALKSLIRSTGLRVELFGSSREFLQAQRPDAPSCLILDVKLPGESGLDLQRALVAAGNHLPVIFITGHGDIPMSVRAIKAGAVAFLTKPFRDQDLLDNLQLALKRDTMRRAQEAEIAILLECFDSLTADERKVLHLLVSGLPNNQIATEMETSEAAVRAHRSELMQKMGAASTADLVRVSETIGAVLTR
ncbi:MAG: response regulator [Steroidobacteraceae bacterium]|jgi:FixJ family two-component response regulator